MSPTLCQEAERREVNVSENYRKIYLQKDIYGYLGKVGSVESEKPRRKPLRCNLAYTLRV